MFFTLIKCADEVEANARWARLVSDYPNGQAHVINSELVADGFGDNDPSGGADGWYVVGYNPVPPVDHSPK